MTEKKSPSEPKSTLDSSSLGVMCSEAQADGVPCLELDFNCGSCDKADLRPADDDDGPSAQEENRDEP